MMFHARMVRTALAAVVLAHHIQSDPASAQTNSLPAKPAHVLASSPDTAQLRVSGTTVTFDLVRSPPALGQDAKAVPELWVLTTEVPWELFDIYVYALDVDNPDAEDADAIARPSKPYVPPDRGFGHEGYPAMGMTRAAAEGFCAWLTTKFADTHAVEFRLPTPAEWTHLASAGTATEVSGNSAEALDDLHAIAWSSRNAEFTTHPVTSKPANAFGLHNTLGNVAEWVMTDTRRPIAMGGSYRDPPEACRPDASQRQTRSWNASDPQIPKSSWWLADCSWVGFRFVTEQDPREVQHDNQEQPDTP